MNGSLVGKLNSSEAFHSSLHIKCLGILLLSLDGKPVNHRIPPCISYHFSSSLVAIYTHRWRERHFKCSVSHPITQGPESKTFVKKTCSLIYALPTMSPTNKIKEEVNFFMKSVSLIWLLLTLADIYSFVQTKENPGANEDASYGTAWWNIPPWLWFRCTALQGGHISTWYNR